MSRNLQPARLPAAIWRSRCAPGDRPAPGNCDAYDPTMDDLRMTLGAFDPDAPLPAAPDPWDYLLMPTVRDAPPWAMAEMIAVEPALVARVAERVVADGSARALAADISRAATARVPVIVTGCGTSEHAAMGVAAILREAWRTAGLSGCGPVAAQALELQLDPPTSGLVIGISHEGGTTATVAALAAARSRGCRTAAITGSAGSPVGGAADVVLETLEMDRSWCHTVGYVSPLAAASAAADLLAGRGPDASALSRLVVDGVEAGCAPAAGATTSGGDADPQGRSAATSIGAAVAAAAHLIVIGSGVDRVGARELVLKVEEAAHVPSAMRDLETFLHGHLPATGARTALVVILTERSGLDERGTRVRQALAAAGAGGLRAAATLSTAAAARVPPELTPAGRIVVPDAPTAPAAIASLLSTAAPLQLVTLAAAAGRGTNPDPIRRDDPLYLRAAELADDPSV